MHYVLTNNGPVPAHETPFAKDAAFGYSTAYLPDYVEEKTGGRIRAADVRQFDTEEDSRVILERLRRLSGNQCCVVNARIQSEVDVFTELAVQVAGEGKRFLFRSAASLLTSLDRLPDGTAQVQREVRDKLRNLHRAGFDVVIFPGNVGEDDSLTLVYDRLSGS